MKAALIILAWLALVALVLPTGSIPIFDDWVYSWSAQRLATDGIFDLPELSAAYPLFQVFWGALFLSLPLVPDLALRISTLALALAGSVAWYLLLRRSGRGQPQSLLILATGLANPIYVLLAPTFMTDLAFASLCQIALLALLVWSQRPGPLSLLLCVAAVTAAAFTRQPGAALAFGLLAAALASRRPGAALAAIAVVAAVFVGQGAFTAEVGAAMPLTERFGDILYGLRVSPLFYVDGLTTVAAYLGLSVAPLAFALGRPRGRLWFLWALWLALAWVLWGSPLLRSGTMWGACELGGARSLLAGRVSACGWQTVARVLALLLSSAGLAALSQQVPGLVRGSLEALRGRQPFATAVVVTTMLMAGGLLALWMFADRYWLLFALLMPALLLGPGQALPRRAGTFVASMLVVIYLGIGFVGANDSFQFLASVEATALELGGHGAGGQVDAGYAVNAKLRYLEMPPAAGGQGRNATVPWVSAVAVSPLTVAKRVEPGWRSIGLGRGDLVMVVLRSR